MNVIYESGNYRVWYDAVENQVLLITKDGKPIGIYYTLDEAILAINRIY